MSAIVAAGTRPPSPPRKRGNISAVDASNSNDTLPSKGSAMRMPLGLLTIALLTPLAAGQTAPSSPKPAEYPPAISMDLHDASFDDTAKALSEATGVKIANQIYGAFP